MKKKILYSIFFSVSVLFIFTLSVAVSPARAADGTRVFTPQDLAQFDGKNGRPAYFAYKGKVYDVTGNAQWTNGDHYGNLAGQDLTGKMAGAPHGEEVLNGLKVMGTYSGGVAINATTPSPVVAAASPTTMQQSLPPTSQPWYVGRIKIFGLSVLGWSGILLGICFVLNFATCFVLPWSSLPLPWKGSKPGADALDQVPAHQHWSAIHKYFAWTTVLLGIFHGVIGFMQMLGYPI